MSTKSPKKFQRIELQVRQELERLGWRCLFHDVQVVRVQIDLIARNPQGLLTLIEVKTQGSAQMAQISFKQMQRLLRTCTFLAQWEPLELRLALVQGTNVRLLPVDALTVG